MNIVAEVSHHFSDGVYAKQMSLPKDHVAQSHRHNYSHLSILASGKVIVDCEGIKTQYTAPACLEIKAEIQHEIYALEDSIFYCVHQVLPDYDLDKIDEVLIKESDYAVG